MGVVRESLEFRTEEAEASLRRTGVSLSDVAGRADDFSGRASKAAQALGVFSPQAQSVAMVVADLADGLSLAATPAGALGIGLLGVGAASVGAVALVAGLTMGIIELAESSAEAVPDLLALQEASGVQLVSEATATRLERTAGAMDALGTASTAAGAALADSFAPAIEEGALLGVQLALAVRDITVRSATMGLAVIEVGTAILDGFTMPLAGATAGIGMLLLVAAKAADILGKDGLAAELKTAGDAAMVFGSGGIVSTGIETTKTALAGYRDEALALRDAQVELARAARDTADAERTVKSAVEDSTAAYREAGLAREANFNRDQQIMADQRAAWEQAGADREARILADLEAEDARLQALTDKRMGALGAVAGVAQGGLSAGLGVVSQAGPVGAVIAAVIQIIQGIQNGMLQDMHGEVMGLFEGLPDMPAMIGDFVEASITEGIPALAEGLGGLIAALPDMIWQILKASTVGLAQAMYEALKSLLDGLFGERTERTESGRAGSAAHDRGSAAAREAAGGSTARSSAGAMGNRASDGARYGVMDPREMLGAMLVPALNRADRRDNLTSSSGVRYGVAGPVRVM